jgi:hypothetical protein
MVTGAWESAASFSARFSVRIFMATGSLGVSSRASEEDVILRNVRVRTVRLLLMRVPKEIMFRWFSLWT